MSLLIAKPTIKITADELDQFPDDGKRREIIDGDLYVSPSPTTSHQALLGELYILFHEAVMRQHLGRVYLAPLDVRLSLHDQVQPDLIVLLGEKDERERGPRLQGPPDIVVEIASSSTTRYDAEEKANLYARFGVPEYWLVMAPDLSGDGQVQIRLLTLQDGGYHHLEPEYSGAFRSRQAPNLIVDPTTLIPNSGH